VRYGNQHLTGCIVASCWRASLPLIEYGEHFDVCLVMIEGVEYFDDYFQMIECSEINFSIASGQYFFMEHMPFLGPHLAFIDPSAG
jgi:hypothetical protein